MLLDGIFWLGHASVKIRGSKVVYIDPWKLRGEEPADVILVTHSHYDHCSEEDVKKISKEGTVIIASEDCRTKVKAAQYNLKIVGPGDKVSIDGIVVEAVPAYNVNKSFHPKENRWLGYVVEMDGKRIYHPGDTDALPEMESLEVDVAFFPVGGTYTMDAEEAARVANRMMPKVAIPIHYGDIVGSIEDARRFKELCRCEVEILEPVYM